MSEIADKLDLNAALAAYEDGDEGAFDVIFDEMRAPLCFFIKNWQSLLLIITRYN